MFERSDPSDRLPYVIRYRYRGDCYHASRAASIVAAVGRQAIILGRAADDITFVV